MTRQGIIDCIIKNQDCSYIAMSEDNEPIESTRLYQFGIIEIENIADELLALNGQEEQKAYLTALKDVKRNLGLNPNTHLIDGFNQRIKQERKEMAKEILQDLENMSVLMSDFTAHLILNTLSQKYGVEVENDQRTDN